MNSKFKIAGQAAVAGSGAALLVLAGWGCGKQEQAQGGMMQMPPPLVAVATAESRDVPDYIDQIGKIAASEAVTITPRIQGQIVGRFFEDGAELKKGQELFKIDPAPSEAALAAAKAQQAQAQAAVAFAKIELDRYAAVAGTKAISKSDYDTKKNALDVANAQLASANAAVTTAELNLSFCSIKSPINGRAGARQVDVGNVVKENEGNLLSVQTIDPIYADFTVNEQQLAAVRENMAHSTLKTLVKLPTDTGDGVEGDLTFLDNAVQDATGTIKLRATLKNPDHHFWPGQFCQVRLVLKTLKDAVLVPSSASQLSQQGPYVFVVKADHTAEMRPVTIGQAQGSDIVITKGLAAGEQVVTDGQMMVRPGGPVRLPGDTTQPGPMMAGKSDSEAPHSNTGGK